MSCLEPPVAARTGHKLCRQGNRTWPVSGALSSALARFDGVAYKRVRSGSRPATALESHLITLIEIPGPRCRESIYRELVGLTELNQ